MIRKRLLAQLLAATAVLVSGCGGGAKTSGSDPGAEALAYVSPRAPLVAVISTDFEHGQGKAARELGERIPGGAAALTGLLAQLHLSYERDLKPALGHDVVVSAPSAAALRDHHLLLSAVAGDRGRLEEAAKAWKRAGTYRGATLYRRSPMLDAAVRGSVLLVADNPAVLRRALDLRARGGGLSATALRGRLGALPAGALVRVVGDVRALLAAHRGRHANSLGKLRWVKSLRTFAAVARIVPSGIQIRFRVDGDPKGLTASDLPIAPGSTSPVPTGDAPLVVGLRDGAHLLAFAERAYRQLEPGETGELDAGKLLIRLATGVDVDRDVIGQLGTTTLTSSDLRHFTLRADVRDAKTLVHALERLAPVAPRFLAAAGLHDVTLDRQPHGRFLVRRAGKPLARFGVIGRALVVTTDPGADMAAVAAARPASIRAPGPGALVARLKAGALRDLLVRTLHLPEIARFALVRLGDTTASLQAATDHLEGAVDVAIAR